MVSNSAVTLAICCLQLAASSYPTPLDINHKQKRQIFREQVLPHAGGKIPEEAFRSDRLALNRLNKEGISIPDGVLLETRHRESHYHSHRNDPDITGAIIKLIQKPDGRYAPPEGHYPFNNLVESTYVIRPPFGSHHSLVIPPHKAIPVPLRLPARPFFAPDDDLFNFSNHIESYLSSDIPGIKIWTGVGTLFHESTPGRILRQAPPPISTRTTTTTAQTPANGEAPFPNLTILPKTSFACKYYTGKMMPDPEANCQVFHLCLMNGQKESFLCPQGSRFDASRNQCSNWKEVSCNGR